MQSEDHIIKLYDYIEDPRDQTVRELIDRFGVYAFAWERDALIIRSTVFDYAQCFLSVGDGSYLFYDHRYEDRETLYAMDSSFERTEGYFLDWLRGLEPDVVRPRRKVAEGLAEEVRVTSSTGAQKGEEVRVTSKTGGQKGTKLAKFSLIPTSALTALAERYGYGAQKYSLRNWEKGYDWSLSYDSLQRHLNSFWEGEDYDPEFPNSLHLSAVLFHAAALVHFSTHPELYAEFDDRPKYGN